MSLLSICQEAASQLGLRQPSLIVGSADLTAQILYRFANQAGKELMRYHDWQNLTTEVTFSTLNQLEQTDAIDPDDFDRMIYNAEVWNRSINQRYSGPTSQRYWQQLRSSTLGGVAGWWRIVGGQMLILPAPTAGQTLAFEYISRRWVMAANGDLQSKYIADTDSARITGDGRDEDLLVLELVWRFRQSRGFAQYAEDMSTCEREKEKMASRDRGSGRIRPERTEDYSYPPPPIFTGTVDA